MINSGFGTDVVWGLPQKNREFWGSRRSRSQRYRRADFVRVDQRKRDLKKPTKPQKILGNLLPKSVRHPEFLVAQWLDLTVNPAKPAKQSERNSYQPQTYHLLGVF